MFLPLVEEHTLIHDQSGGFLGGFLDQVVLFAHFTTTDQPRLGKRGEACSGIGRQARRRPIGLLDRDVVELGLAQCRRIGDAR